MTICAYTNGTSHEGVRPHHFLDRNLTNKHNIPELGSNTLLYTRNNASRVLFKLLRLLAYI